MAAVRAKSVAHIIVVEKFAAGLALLVVIFAAVVTDSNLIVGVTHVNAGHDVFVADVLTAIAVFVVVVAAIFADRNFFAALVDDAVKLVAMPVVAAFVALLVIFRQATFTDVVVAYHRHCFAGIVFVAVRAKAVAVFET